MSAEVFFDTNVLLYLLSGDPAKAGRAEALLAEGGTISVQVLNEFASVCRRKLGLDLADVSAFVDTFQAVCEVVPVDLPLHENGVAIAYRHQISVYDGLIVAAALRAGCRTLFTEDLNHGQRVDGLVIVNPFTP
ncbi:PIN domain-containing protein [Pseudoxanthobacter sp. M-2]|uniref:PIN domain-containing protein n=1 Tax=Pseudoxanthobacter sp. M-2 TaxID=3078754 RepID=UPI0038FC3C6F